MDCEKVKEKYSFEKERKSRDKSRRQRINSSGDHSFKNNGNPYNLNWSTHSLSSQPRLFPNNEPTFSTFPSYHVSYPVESYPPLSVYPPMYSATISPPPLYPTPPIRKNRRNDGKRTLPSGQLRLKEQEYASLPPVHCDGSSDKSSDSESISKRHFSDPGIGPASSDDSQRRSPVSPFYLNLIEEVRDLKDSRQKMASELTTLRDEFNELKMKTCTHCLAAEYQPGSLTDAIGEFRKAARLTESALLAKLDGNVEAATSKLQKLLAETTDRLSAVESKMEKLESEDEANRSEENGEGSVKKAQDVTDSKTPPIEKLVETNVPDAFRMLHSLEQQKRQLEEDLRDALVGRSEAEANTQKLERLVAILRTKINGLSTDTSLADENHPLGGASTIDCNPFIIMDTLGKTHTKGNGEHNICIDNISKCVAESKIGKANGGPPIPPKSRNSASMSSTSNPSLPVKPNLSSLPKPVLGQALKNVNGMNRQAHTDSESPCQGTKSNAQTTKFVVGKAVTAQSQNLNKFSDSSTDSSVDNSSPVVPHLPASITITGPVTDL